MSPRPGGPPGDEADSPEPEPPEVGGLGDEVVRLLGALAGWARDQGASLGEGVTGAAAGAAELIREVDEHLARETCRYCPVCRAVELVRECSPEVRDHLQEAAGSLARASVSLLTAVAAHAGAASSARPGGFEHIDLDGDDLADHGRADDEWPEEDG